MRTLVLGDIHGGFRALIQCFKLSKFNYLEDKLIVLGDVCDGWAEVRQCIDDLLRVKNLVFVLGNHDEWAGDWFDHIRKYVKSDYVPKPELQWTSQGGLATLKSYDDTDQFSEPAVGIDYRKIQMPKEHLDLLENAPTFYVENNRLFVHGGIDPQTKADGQPKDMHLWDRTLIHNAYHRSKQKGAKKLKLTPYDEVFVGHTTTRYYGIDEPMHCGNIWNLDTGGGWGGKLTIMDVDTKEYWQSDVVKTLYPEEKGR